MKIFICLIFVSIVSINACYVSLSQGIDSLRYARFKNECYILNQNGDVIDNKDICIDAYPNDNITLCDNLIIKNDSEVSERYKILVQMSYYPDISLFFNSELLNYDYSLNAYVSNWHDLEFKQVDINNINLLVGNSSINESITIVITIEQRD